jgi:hypothetical protein
MGVENIGKCSTLPILDKLSENRQTSAEEEHSEGPYENRTAHSDLCGSRQRVGLPARVVLG